MSDTTWTTTHREALEMMARIARRDDPDPTHPFLADAIDAALAEIADADAENARLHREIARLMAENEQLKATLKTERKP